MDQVRPVVPNRLVEPIKQTYIPAHAADCEVHGNAKTGDLVPVEVTSTKADYMAVDIGSASEALD